MILASVHSVAVLYNHKMKRFLQNLIANVVKPMIIDNFEKDQEIGFLVGMA